MEETMENQTNQTGLSQTPVAVENKKVKPLTIVILLIAILLIGVGGVYAGMQLGKKQVSPSELISEFKTPTQAVATVQPKPTTISTSAETANWKTYTNQKFNFSFKYPENFMILSDKIKAISNLSDLFNGLTLINSINKDNGQPPQITLFIYDTTKTDQEFVYADFNNQLTNWEIEKQRLGSSLAKPIMSPLTEVQGSTLGAKKVEGTGVDTAPNSKYVWYLFKKNNLLFRFSVYYGTYNPDTKTDGSDEKVKLDQILSTFKFID